MKKMKYLITTLVLFSFCLSPMNAQFSIVEIMYNNPGEDLYEYVKVWNVSGEEQNLSDFSMTAGLAADFPSVMLAQNDWFFVVADSTAFVDTFNTFGHLVIQGTGALNNNGEAITIVNNGTGQTVDEVIYENGNGWPTFAGGNGSSIHFCGDTNADKNDPTLWTIPSSTLNFENNSQPFYGLLGDIIFQCVDRGRVTFFSNTESVSEGEGVIEIPVYVIRGMQDQVSVTLTSNSGTATNMVDFELLTPSFAVTSSDNTDVVIIEIAITDDTELEADEIFTLTFEGFTSEYLALTRSIEITIIDNDEPLTEDLILTGVFDAHPGFSGTKGAEFFAVNDIPDLSVFGVGVVNNGNGTDGVEYTFPAESLAAGSFIYLAEDSTAFADYFGQSTSLIFGSINVNGNDAIELFENEQPLDVFGEVDIDGSGLAWEYLDGWAYRNSGTGPDGRMFVEANWTYSGVGALEGPVTNASGPNPFPIGTYSLITPTEIISEADNYTFPFGTESAVLAVTSNDLIPGDITEVLIQGSPDFGVEVTDTFTIAITIAENYCGTSGFSYTVTNGVSTDTAEVVVTVECQAEFPLLTIEEVTTEDAVGLAESIGTTCELIGVVHGVNLSDSTVLFTIIDVAGDGIAVFNNESDLGYTVTEGDEVSVFGTITQFNGLTEILADQIDVLSTTAALSTASVVTSLGENTESRLVQIQNVQYVDINQWGGGNSGFNFMVTDGTNEYEVRIDNNVDLFMLPAPSDAMSLNITGIGGQFDSSSPFDSGYQLLPRFEQDIETTPLSTDNILASSINIFPNPTLKILNINSEEALDELRITDILGREVLHRLQPSQQLKIQVGHLTKGVYTVECIKDNLRFAMKLIVQ